jgi:hypothetical protein
MPESAVTVRTGKAGVDYYFLHTAAVEAPEI